MSKITRAIPKEAGTGDEEEDIVIGAKVRRNFNADANNKKADLKGHELLEGLVKPHVGIKRAGMCGQYQRLGVK